MKFVPVCLALLLALAAPMHAESSKGKPADEPRYDPDARPIEPPRPFYPVLASMVRLEGVCIVRFTVNPFGRPVEIEPSCSHIVFCQAAREGVGRAIFEPARLDGRAVSRTNVVYPMEFRLGPEDLKVPAELIPCTTQEIS